MRPNKCGEHCGCQKISKNQEYVFPSPVRSDDRTQPTIKVKSSQEFFNWFFVTYAAKDSCMVFDDFRLIGCWNWIFDWPENEYFSEISERYTAAKELGIRPAENFDLCQAGLLDLMLTFASELNKAIQEKTKRQNANS